MGDCSVAVLSEEEHLPVPRVGIERPAVRKYHDRTLAPVLVINCGAITRLDCARCDSSFCWSLSRSARGAADGPRVRRGNERLSQSAKWIDPMRCLPLGVSDRSSISAPKKVAWVSVIIGRLSWFAARKYRAISSRGCGSGPDTSTVELRAGPSASLASVAATSSDAIG